MKRSVVRLDDESSPWAPGRCVWFFLFFACLALLGLSVATYPLHHQQQLQRLRQQAAATGTEPVHLVVLMHGMHGAFAWLASRCGVARWLGRGA